MKCSPSLQSVSRWSAVACAHDGGHSSIPANTNLETDDIGSLPRSVTLARLSFDRLYHRYRNDVLRWVRAFGAREADRQDLVQDIFILAYRRFPDFDGANPAGWLYQIARRKVRDYRSLFWIRYALGIDSAPTFDRWLRQLRTPMDDLQTAEEAKLLERLLANLADDKRNAFIWFELEGRTGEQIATWQNVSVNTVWARIYQARRRLVRQARRLQR